MIQFQPTNTSSTIVEIPCTSPELGLTCTPKERCGFCRDGVEEREQWEVPHASFSGGSANGLQAILGLAVSGEGEITHSEIPAVLQRFLTALNDDTSRQGLISETFSGRSPQTTRIVTNEEGMSEFQTQGGCLVIEVGTTDEQIKRRLTQLHAVFVWAHNNNSGITWN